MVPHEGWEKTRRDLIVQRTQNKTCAYERHPETGAAAGKARRPGSAEKVPGSAVSVKVCEEIERWRENG